MSSSSVPVGLSPTGKDPVLAWETEQGCVHSW